MILYIRLFQADNVYVLGCTIFSGCSRIGPVFLHSMCMGEVGSHAGFQVTLDDFLSVGIDSQGVVAM